MRNRTSRSASALLVSSLIVLGACGGGNDQQDAGSSSNQSATVLLDAGYAGAWPAGLDPATNLTARANISMMNAIYGGLFQLSGGKGGENAEIIGVLARDYEIVDDGKTFIIHLREDVTFSDGTALDAEAVRFNIERNLACPCAPTNWPWSSEERVTILGPYTLALHFTKPYGPVVSSFPIANINWIASPTALRRMGEEQFRITPVGAGPFRVVDNQLSSKLVLERNPTYWQDDRPHLDRLVFQSIGSEQSAIQALLSGDAHAYEGMTSTPLIEQADDHEKLAVTQQPPTGVYVIQLNTLRPPFDDYRAREAIYYATDVASIREGLFDNRYPISQSFTGPGGLFHHPEVPEYRAYDPEKARAIVEELGAFKVSIGTIRSYVAEQVITALQSQWQAAGMEVTIESYELAAMIDEFRQGEWEAMLQSVGSYDPEASGGVTFRFRSDQLYSGVHDAKLDALLTEAASALEPSTRDRLYQEAARHISDNAYAPFLFAFAPAQVTVPGLRGPGLTTKIPPILVNPGVLWQDVRFEEE